MIQHNICHNKIAYHEHEIADNARTHARSHARSHTPTLARSHAPALARSHAPTCIHCLHVHMLCPLIRCYVCPAGGTRRAAGTCTPSFPTDGSYHAVCIYMCTYIYIYIYIYTLWSKNTSTCVYSTSTKTNAISGTSAGTGAELKSMAWYSMARTNKSRML